MDTFSLIEENRAPLGAVEIALVAGVAAAAFGLMAVALLHVLSPLGDAVHAVKRGELPTFGEEITVTAPPRSPAPGLGPSAPRS